MKPLILKLLNKYMITSESRKEIKLFSRKSEKDTMESWNDFKQNIPQKIQQYNMGTTNPEDTTQIHNKALEIIDRMAAGNRIDFDHAALGTCALFQCGAHIKGVANRKFTVQNYEFTKENLLYASNLSKNTFPLRAIARAIREEILTVARAYQIPGHLYRRFKLENPEFVYENEEQRIEIMISCTDFQTDNPDIPAPVKTFLAKRDIARKEKK